MTKIEIFFKKNRNEIIRHSIGWSIFYIIDFCFVIGFTPNVNSNAILTYLSTVILYIGCFYSISAINRKLLPHRKLITSLATLLILLGYSLFNAFWDVNIMQYTGSIERFESSPINLYLFEIWRFSTSALYAFAYWIYLQRIKDQQLRRVTQKQLHDAELAFLKAQINPHFLFNTLNFVYGDIVTKSSKSGKAILDLTKLLRYTVESTKSENSSIKKEVDAIDQYLHLQSLRFTEKMCVTFTKKGLLPFFSIPPLILLSLVENAFKYGIIDDPNQPIEININVNKEDFVFRCKNLKRLDFKDKEATSVGIANIERRLEMTYGNFYSLTVNDLDLTYEVILHLIWKK